MTEQQAVRKAQRHAAGKCLLHGTEQRFLLSARNLLQRVQQNHHVRIVNHGSCEPRGLLLQRGQASELRFRQRVQP